MDGVAELMAVLAILIALAALWMASEMIKKAEVHTREVIEGHMRGVKDTLEEQSREIARLSQKVEAVDARTGQLGDAQGGQTSRLETVEYGLRTLTQSLQALDQSIPSRYRSNGKAAKKTG